ncbi:DUF6873 family GME fold protein [Clostridium massiliamazoniense]|uniref:DUF6873 family GME fold protein n=1 Tax=Clostridium massiliamazoniense TaxID=1347366 RepID=UPI0006D84C11|nr:hypothetical protein [Clostridium massiliamazoniense]
MNISFVDYRLTEKQINLLLDEGLNIIKVPKSNNLYDAISGHPDIQLNIINSKKIILAKNSNLSLETLNQYNIDFEYSSKELEEKYPKNIFLNAVNLKDFFIHNFKFTDKNLLKHVSDKELINIKQGYSKCSIAIVNDKALITSDLGIYNTLKKYPLDVLLIPSGDIILPGLSYGFIGGTCGLISEDKMAFLGDLKNHSYGNDIKDFLFKHNVEPIYLDEGKLIDRGSILTLF